jgi:hypothetical protein
VNIKFGIRGLKDMDGDGDIDEIDARIWRRKHGGRDGRNDDCGSVCI